MRLEVNFEYRFPLIDFLLMGWPGRFALGPIGAVGFFDIGSAFDDTFKPFAKTPAGNLVLNDLNADFGFGIRARLGWLPLRFDWGWKTDFVDTAPKPQFSFSIAPDF